MSVLVVDDNANRLATHKGFLEDLDEDLEVVTSNSTSEAKKIIANSPVFETVLLDINFDPSDINNLEGLHFCKHLRDIGYPAHRVVYSQFLKDDSGVAPELEGVFDDITIRELNYDDYRKLLNAGRTAYLKKLSNTRLQALEVLSLNGIEITKISALHDSLETQDIHLDDLYKEYTKSGYKVVVAVQDNKQAQLGAKFLLWSKLYNGGVYFEVHKVPEIYAYGDSEEEALEMLNDVIVGLYSDFSKSKSNGDLDSDNRVIFDFVKLLYETA